MLSGHLQEPSLTLSGLFSDPFAQVTTAQCLPAGFTRSELQMMCMDGLRRLTVFYVYTLGHRCDMLRGPSKIPECVHTTLNDYISDERLLVPPSVLNIVGLAVSEPIDRELIPSCEGSGGDADRGSGGGLKVFHDLLAAGNARLPGLALLFPVSHLPREACRRGWPLRHWCRRGTE